MIALTVRQLQVAQLVAGGAALAEAAQALGIAPATAKVHLGAAYLRLGVQSRAALAAMATTLAGATPRIRGNRLGLLRGELLEISGGRLKGKRATFLRIHGSRQALVEHAGARRHVLLAHVRRASGAPHDAQPQDPVQQRIWCSL